MTKIFKLILVGDGRVGKTSLRRQYFGESFKAQYVMTIGADFALKRAKGNLLQIWDLAGQPVFQLIRRNYYQGAHGALLMFDLTSKDSFESLDQWLQEMLQAIGKQVSTVVLGNKTDLVHDGIDHVSEEMIQVKLDELSIKYSTNLTYLPTSAATGVNVDKAFDDLLTKITS